ncbi:hypothetical protein [Microbispora bryophytorum]|uniref:hypothetical protein n=1 Tax=Microbispora bryophytorum TaxID=1460882 RepID=UPI0033D5CA23
MTATVPPPYTILLDARRAGATTGHLLDALAYSAAANAAEFRVTSTWDSLLWEANDRVFGAAATAAMHEADTYDLDLWDGVTYDDLPTSATARVLASALHAVCKMCDRTDEDGTPIAELLSERGADDHEISVTPALPDDTERGDLVLFAQKGDQTVLTPPAGQPIMRFMQQVTALTKAHPEHTVTWTISHPATGEVLHAYELS